VGHLIIEADPGPCGRALPFRSGQSAWYPLLTHGKTWWGALKPGQPRLRPGRVCSDLLRSWPAAANIPRLRGRNFVRELAEGPTRWPPQRLGNDLPAALGCARQRWVKTPPGRNRPSGPPPPLTYPDRLKGAPGAGGVRDRVGAGVFPGTPCRAVLRDQKQQAWGARSSARWAGKKGKGKRTFRGAVRAIKAFIAGG